MKAWSEWFSAPESRIGTRLCRSQNSRPPKHTGIGVRNEFTIQAEIGQIDLEYRGGLLEHGGCVVVGCDHAGQIFHLIRVGALADDLEKTPHVVIVSVQPVVAQQA